MPYSDYLSSEHWKSYKEKRRAKKKRPEMCRMCFSLGETDTHHRTYERIGHEWIDDTVLLCRECHSFIHKNFDINEDRFFRIHLKFSKPWFKEIQKRNIWYKRKRSPQKFKKSAFIFFNIKLNKIK